MRAAALLKLAALPRAAAAALFVLLQVVPHRPNSADVESRRIEIEIAARRDQEIDHVAGLKVESTAVSVFKSLR